MPTADTLLTLFLPKNHHDPSLEELVALIDPLGEISFRSANGLKYQNPDTEVAFRLDSCPPLLTQIPGWNESRWRIVFDSPPRDLARWEISPVIEILRQNFNLFLLDLVKHSPITERNELDSLLLGLTDEPGDKIRCDRDLLFQFWRYQFHLRNLREKIGGKAIVPNLRPAWDQLHQRFARLAPFAGFGADFILPPADFVLVSLSDRLILGNVAGHTELLFPRGYLEKFWEPLVFGRVENYVLHHPPSGDWLKLELEQSRPIKDFQPVDPLRITLD